MPFVQLTINALIAGASYALVALGFSLVFSVSRFFHFELAASYTICAYAALTLIANWGLIPVLALPLALALTFAIGCGFELLAFRPLASRHASSLVKLLSSLGLSIAGRSLVALVFGDQTRLIRKGTLASVLPILGGRITYVQFLGITITVAVFGLMWFGAHKSPAGMLLRAVACDSELARVRGLPVDRVKFIVFGIGSVIVGLAAIIAAYDSDLTPTMGFNALLPGIAAAIVGGMGSIRGALLGGVLIGFAQQFGGWQFQTEWQDAVVFIILIGFLIVRPQGFFGRPLRRTAV
jgi:branched-chain amino acid transport system permease protein